ncbi:MAG: serine/threonine protein kinase, partial [Gemmatimonadetes bacterium]|nr:serine/threonine protein kinase [Gemmatimonadota bacterium]NIT66995.1 serine/threonine protein kinase [Gemmatimonadota bacterium]NIU53196.1 serine/threonine protein kinase [Gemmatimonadota bacterium]NIV23787.1 serine/threonine protein kinase [Gemmatimonadota bacterium]NIW37066.1 serine/threonine protein kinase [Gemmatimonadota bacterium]
MGTSKEIIKQQIFETPEPLPPAVPARIREAVMAALAKRPGSRLATAAELVAALE